MHTLHSVSKKGIPPFNRKTVFVIENKQYTERGAAALTQEQEVKTQEEVAYMM